MAKQTAKKRTDDFVLPRNDLTTAAMRSGAISTYYRYINGMFWLLRYSGEVPFDDPTPLDLIISHGSYMARNLDKVVYDRSLVPAYSDVDQETGLMVGSQELVQESEDRHGLSHGAYTKALDQANDVIDHEQILLIFRDMGIEIDPSQFRQMAYDKALSQFLNWKKGFDERQKNNGGPSKFASMSKAEVEAEASLV